MPTYAQSTDVSAEPSRGEIERMLARYGASSFAYGWEGQQAAVGFRMNGRQIRFVLQMPAKNDPQFQTNGVNQHASRRATPKQQEAAWEQACP